MFETLLQRVPLKMKRRLVDLTVPSLDEVTYSRLADRGFSPNAIIDVGACAGSWTRTVRKIFPTSRSLMIEAEEEMRPHLDKTCAEVPDCSYSIALLGGEDGREVTFYHMGSGSSYMPERSNTDRKAEQRKLRTLDELVDTSLLGELFLKIDVQGAELEVLKGASETLRRCGLVQLEVALLSYNEGAPLINEVVGFMHERGFVPLDIGGFIRPRGLELVQIDVLFAPQTSPLRPSYFSY